MMLLWLAVSGSLYLAYLLTLSPTVPLEDGGEMIRAAFTLGVTHPPGYPLYTLLGRLAWRRLLRVSRQASQHQSPVYLVALDM